MYDRGTVVGKIGGGLLTGWFAQKNLTSFLKKEGGRQCRKFINFIK